MAGSGYLTLPWLFKGDVATTELRFNQQLESTTSKERGGRRKSLIQSQVEDNAVYELILNECLSFLMMDSFI